MASLGTYCLAQRVSAPGCEFRLESNKWILGGWIFLRAGGFAISKSCYKLQIKHQRFKKYFRISFEIWGYESIRRHVFSQEWWTWNNDKSDNQPTFCHLIVLSNMGRFLATVYVPSCISNTSLNIHTICFVHFRCHQHPWSPWGLWDLYQFLCWKQSCLGLVNKGRFNATLGGNISFNNQYWDVRNRRCLIDWQRPWWKECIDAVIFHRGHGRILSGTMRTEEEIWDVYDFLKAGCLLQQRSTCTHALLRFQYGIWIFVRFWNPFVMCFVAFNYWNPQFFFGRLFK